MGTNQEVERDGDIGCCGYVLWLFSILLVFLFFPFSIFVIFKVVAEYERAVILRLGRVNSEPAGPGVIMILPCIDEMQKVDLRTITYDVPQQEILSRDTVTVSVDAVVYYRVANPVMSVCNVENAFVSAQLLSATTLRNVLGMRTMAEILTEREQVASTMQDLLHEATDYWGIQVERVEIKDVRLPFQLQRAMAAEAEASREAKAKVVAAQGEQNASRALKEAADVMMESPAAMQLRYLQTLGQMATGKDSTMLFPIPINMMDIYKGKLGTGSKPKSSSSKSPKPKATPPPPPQPEVKQLPPTFEEEHRAKTPPRDSLYTQSDQNRAVAEVEVVTPQNVLERDMTVESMHL